MVLLALFLGGCAGKRCRPCGPQAAPCCPAERPPITGFTLTNATDRPLVSARVYAKLKSTTIGPGTLVELIEDPNHAQVWQSAPVSLNEVISLLYVVRDEMQSYDFRVDIHDENSQHTVFFGGSACLWLQEFLTTNGISHFTGRGTWTAAAEPGALIVD